MRSIREDTVVSGQPDRGEAGDTADLLPGSRETMLQSLPLPIALLDSDVRIVCVNPAFALIAGVSPTMHRGRTLAQVVPELAMRLDLVCRQVLSSGQTAVDIECTGASAAHGQGRRHWLASICRAAPSDGATGHISLTLIDNTERKHYEQERDALLEREHSLRVELQQSLREMELVSAALSHDVRGPLRTLAGSLAILAEDECDLSTASRHGVERMSKSAERIGGMVESVLGHIRGLRQPVKPRVVDVAALFRHVWDEMRKNGRHARFVVEPEMPSCNADPNLVRIVCENLLDNALKYSCHSSGACIEIGGFEADGQSVYFVRDNGAGFDQQQAVRLFNPFQCLHRSEVYDGNGLGLASVRRAVERHGGRVWAVGEPDVGAVFYFSLPAAEDRAAEFTRRQVAVG